MNVPKVDVALFNDENETLVIEIENNGQVLKSENIDAVKGYNKVSLNLDFAANPNSNLKQGDDNQFYPIAGDYGVKISNKKKEVETILTIE